MAALNRRRYRYVGPPGLLRSVRPGALGHAVRCPADLDSWAAGQGMAEPFTYVVDADGLLRLAARRSEHVACAGGGDVLAAGEVSFCRAADGWAVDEVSNQSTGYCPDPDCWPALAEALDRAGIGRPGGFTQALVFRRCDACGERNVVREGVFVCVLCDSDLPRVWNFTR